MESDIQSDSPSQEAELAGMFGDEPEQQPVVEDTPDELDIDLDEPEETPEESEEEFEIKVNGKTQKLTKSQLIEKAQRAEGAMAKFEEAAQLRKEAEELKAALPEREKQLHQVLTHYIQQAQEMMPKEPNWQALLQADIQNGTRHYDMVRLDWDAKQRDLAQAKQAKEVLDQREAEAKSASNQGRLREEMAKIQEVLPEWKDPSKAAEGAKAIGSYLKEKGIPDSIIENIDDHRILLMARKAMLYDQALSRRQSAQVTTRPAGVVERPAASQSAVPRAQINRQKAEKAFSADPSINNLANFFA